MKNRLAKWIAVFFIVLLVNTAYVAAFATPSIFYMGNVLIHLCLGIALAIGLFFQLRKDSTLLSGAPAAIGLFGVSLVLGLLIQVAMLSVYLVLADRATLIAIFRAWRPSLLAGFMGAFASQMWYLAFALETAAKVRTLALVEILFAQVVSRNMFKQSLASREALGIGLIILGVVLLLNL